MLGVFIALFLIALSLCYVYFKRKFGYWASRGVEVPQFAPVIGHVYKLFVKAYRWEYIDTIYKQYEDERFWGMYELTRPSLHIRDPELIREILVRHADHFIDRRTFEFTGDDKVMNEMLTTVKGERWKSLRSLLSPTFTSGKIKGMFPLILSISEDLVASCDKRMAQDSYVEINSVFCKFTMEVITSCAFGIEANCLQDNDSEFSKAVYKIASANMGLATAIKLAVIMMSPKLFTALGLHFMTKEMFFLEDVVKLTIESRRKAGVKRGDFLDVMLEALDEHRKSDQSNKYPMTETTIIAQSILFLLAGFDTTSNALSFAMFLLAKNPDCQTMLRKELRKIVEVDGELTYASIMEAQYLDSCFSESLRLIPPAHSIERKCTRGYRIPGTEIDLEEDMIVAIPVWSLHRDPKYWPEPTKFDPERFLPENKQNIVPYTYMPFGQGPRNCIAMRFAQMEAKVALAKVILNFEVSLKPGFDEVKLGKSPNTLRPDKDGIPLKMQKIKQC